MWNIFMFKKTNKLFKLLNGFNQMLVLQYFFHKIFNLNVQKV